MNRLENAFKVNGKDFKKVIIPYITAGDPNLEKTYSMVLGMEAAGADIIELGFPYSDPIADGPVIQRASERALKAGVNIEDCLSLVERLRKHTQIPIVILLYYNQIFCYGEDNFVNRCNQVGIDGLVVPDMPLVERKKWRERYFEMPDLIPFATPTSFERLEEILPLGSGFVYCVSAKGVTGVRQEFDENLEKLVLRIKEISNLPVAIGFGIRDEVVAKSMLQIAEGAIVGSAIVEQVEKGIVDNTELQRVSAFVSKLSLAREV